MQPPDRSAAQGAPRVYWFDNRRFQATLILVAWVAIIFDRKVHMSDLLETLDGGSDGDSA